MMRSKIGPGLLLRRNNMVQRKFIYLMGVIIIILLMLPYIVNGENSYVTIHDFLDGIFIYPHLIKQSNAIFDFDSTLGMMNGIKRMEFPMTFPWEFKPAINYIFPGYSGLLINLILVKIVAYTGMFLLVKDYISNNDRIILFCSLLFAFIPFYSDFGISSAGIPLVVWAILNTLKHIKVCLSLLALLIFSLYSSFALSGLFVCAVILGIFIYDTKINGRVNKNLLVGLISMGIVYLISNWYLVYDFIGGANFVSHRHEWINTKSFVDLISELFFDLLFVSNYHAGAFYALPIVLTSFIIFYFYKKNDSNIKYYIYSFLILVFLITIGHILKLLPIRLFTEIQFDRFYFMYPAVCIILLAKSMDMLVRNCKTTFVVAIISLSTFCVVSKNIEYGINVFKMFGKNISNQPSFSQFYDTSLFAKISKDLNICQDLGTKVVSVGIFPAVLTYNGFWSLDGYMSNYSLDYKHHFRKIIAVELSKNNKIRLSFDNWGNRCAIFPSELGKENLISGKDNRTINNLDIDVKILKEMGCQYVFSAVDILNYKELNLIYVNSYTTPTSFYKVRVYKI